MGDQLYLEHFVWFYGLNSCNVALLSNFFKAGVELLAYQASVTPEEIILRRSIPVFL
jgi:hypothetical protein